MREILDRNVKRETQEHYSDQWPLGADARRSLYLKYARELPPDVAIIRGLVDPTASTNPYEKPPRDIWREVAEKIIDRLGGQSQGTIGLDIGASSGYFITTMLKMGYEGRLVGVDIEQETQAAVETIIRSQFPEADIVLGKSDAQKLRMLEYSDEKDSPHSETIPQNYFDFATALFLLYHVPSTRSAYNAAHRAVKPGGTVVFSGRDTLNQHHLWTLGNVIATGLGVESPNSFYSHHSTQDMQTFLETSKKYELQEVIHQGEHLWIPNTDEGWFDYKMALRTLPYGKKYATGEVLRIGEMEEYLETVVRPQFESQAAANDGYFIDYVFQKAFICKVKK